MGSVRTGCSRIRGHTLDADQVVTAFFRERPELWSEDVETVLTILVFDPSSCNGESAAACTFEVVTLIPLVKPLKYADEGYAVAKSIKKGRTKTKDAAKTAGKTCKFNSFTADTPVLMADGSKKPIKDVKLGDLVMAVNPITGVTGPREVIDLIRHSGLHTMVKVRLADGTVLDATDEHPFWVENAQSWVEAIDLAPGDVLVEADGDKNLVFATLVTKQDLTAYNLTVVDLHTYFAGAEPVLVHNAGGYTPPPTDRVLQGFPDASFVGRGSPKKGGGYRPRWSLPDGRVLEWDSQHGTVEMWTNAKKNAKHLGEFDPDSGSQLPGNTGKPIKGRKLGGC